MSADRVWRAEALNRVASGELKLMDAAKLMQVSYRHAKRLYHRYRATGIAGLVHGNAGRRSNRAKPEEYRLRVMELAKQHCGGEADGIVGPSALAEQLERLHGLKVNVETLRRWMLAEGLWYRRRAAAEGQARDMFLEQCQ